MSLPPFTCTDAPANENPSIGATRSIPLSMHPATAASSSSAGLKASDRPSGSVSILSTAPGHRGVVAVPPVKSLCVAVIVYSSMTSSGRAAAEVTNGDVR